MLMPAFMGAMTLAILPAWLLPMQNSGQFVGWLYLFGVMMLGVSSFGREIGLKTVPFMLAQPLDRSRVWWTKIAVLGISAALVFGAWCASLALSPQELYLRTYGMNSSEGVAVSALIVTVLTTGGVWMTLLLRQMSAAFWLAFLIPVVMSLAIKAIGAPDWLAFTALGIYSLAALLMARWQFLHLQDTGWSGAAVTFGRTKAVQEASLVRERVPWRALVRKELKLQEFTPAGDRRAVRSTFGRHCVAQERWPRLRRNHAAGTGSVWNGVDRRAVRGGEPKRRGRTPVWHARRSSVPARFAAGAVWNQTGFCVGVGRAGERVAVGRCGGNCQARWMRAREASSEMLFNFSVLLSLCSWRCRCSAFMLRR